MSDKQTFDIFAERLIKRLESGTAPWQKSWRAGESRPPLNPVSEKPYKSINRLMLQTADDPRYLGAKQAKEREWQLKPGAEAREILFWEFTERRPVLEADGQTALDDRGRPRFTETPLERPRLQRAEVYHVSQLRDADGRDIPALAPRPLAWDPREKAEALLVGSGVRVVHHDRGAFKGSLYDPKKDEIYLMRREDYESAGAYYQEALHELARCVRHPDRLNRPAGPAGSPDYAKEELRAEIAAFMLTQDLGLPYAPKGGPSYAAEWVKALKADPNEIVRAARDAEKIREYLMGLEMKQGQSAETEKNYLDVPFEEKDAARAAGARWDKEARLWFAPEGADLAKLADWLPKAPRQEQARPASEKTYLVVPFTEKKAAQAAGARWDKEAKLWFAPARADLSKLAGWLPDKAPRPEPALSPPEEFAQVLAQAGLKIQGAPLMNGKIQRCAVEGGHNGNKDGAYQAYLDGRPNGWVENHKTGHTVKWLATGQMLTEEQKAALKAEAAERQARQEAERRAAYEAAAIRVREKLAAALAPTMVAAAGIYLEKKGLKDIDIAKIDPDLKADEQGHLLVAGRNIVGEVRTLQHITPDGEKYFEKGSQKSRSFHALGEIGEKPSEILLAEGYATGLSLHLATGLPVAVAFDAGNLKPVAEALRAKFPETALTICADNDHSKAQNVGQDKATDATVAVKGRILSPNFTDEEMAKGLTDFNDLHQSRGLPAVRAMFGVVEEKDTAQEKPAKKSRKPSPAKTKTSAPAAETGLSR